MKRFVLICLCISGIAFPQRTDKSYIKSEMENAEKLLKTSKINYPGDASIDIKYYKLDLSLDYSAQLLKGKVTVNAVPIQNDIDSFYLDLYSGLTVDSVISDGLRLSFNHDANKLLIKLKKDYTANEEFTVTVIYQGNPNSTGFGSFEFGTHAGKPAMYTLSEPYGSSDWWPCKDTPGDKADSSDVWITCDQSMKGASNGNLEEVIINGDGTRTYKWKNHYPISPYLISLAITDYSVYTTYFKYSESDSMPIINYVYPETLNNNVKLLLDETANMLTVFSEKFGLYPFIKEKYGHAQFGWGGGMEHQTLTSVGGFSRYLIAHELAHQWFGDKITCRDWHHIWLNEGFATFCEAVYQEAIEGRQGYLSNITQEMSNAQHANGSVYADNISSVNEIFDGARSYSKGGVVLHMLRGLTGDSVFFNIMKTYASDSSVAYGTAVTEDFQAVAEKIYGSSLGYFFQEWIYGTGFPVYNVNWSAIPSTNNLYNITLNITQTQNALFTMPVQVKVITTTGDTLLTLFNNDKNQTYNFSVRGNPSLVSFDPDNWILKSAKVTSVEDNNSLAGSFVLEQNYPNPFNPSTIIEFVIPSNNSHLPQKVSLKIYDIMGNEIAVLINKELPAGAQEVVFDGRDKNGNSLASGAYYYTLKIGEASQTKKMMLLR